MRLLELQRRMAADIMRPLTGSDRLALEIRADYVQPNDRLTSTERLQIYSRSYWYRLIDSMHEDFPGLRAVLGAHAFDQLVRAYLADCPSRSFTLRDLGSQLEGWMRKNRGHAGNKLPQALDMARLEWAHIEAWDGLVVTPLGPADVLDLGPEAKLGLQPHVRLVKLRFPVDELRLRIKKAGEVRTFASGLAWRKLHPRYVAVHRVDLSVFYKAMTPKEFQILEAIRNECSISKAIERVVGKSSRNARAIELRIGAWFRTWAELGWLYSAASGVVKTSC